MRYKFDLVLGTEAGCEEVAEKRCEMDIYSVPWEEEMSVQWDNVKCHSDEEITTKANRIRLSVPLVKDLPQLRVGIVDLTERDSSPQNKPLLGSDDHDKVPHGLIMGGSAHGPRFDSDYTVKELKSEAVSQAELKQLQSLGSFHEFLSEHGKEYQNREEYKYRYSVFRDNMKKVQFMTETEQGTAKYGATVFADLTEAEFKQQLGLTPVWKSHRLQEDNQDWPPADIPDVEVRAIPLELQG